jgi:hypothetical protein
MVLFIVFAFTIEWWKAAVDHICNAATAENSRGSVTTELDPCAVDVVILVCEVYGGYFEDPMIFGHTFLFTGLNKASKPTLIHPCISPPCNPLLCRDMLLITPYCDTLERLSIAMPCPRKEYTRPCKIWGIIEKRPIPGNAMLHPVLTRATNTGSPFYYFCIKTSWPWFIHLIGTVIQ